MPTHPADSTTPAPQTPRKRSLLPLILAAVVIAVAAALTWHFVFARPTPAANKTTFSTRPARAPYQVIGAIAKPPAAGTVTIALFQPAWTDEQRTAWQQRVNQVIADACKGLNDNQPPPTVTPDPASVRAADQAMAKRLQAARPAAPWKNAATAEFLAFLKENAVEVTQSPAAPDGTFSVPVAPPAGVPYILHARGPNARWLDTVRPGNNRVDLNDANLVAE